MRILIVEDSPLVRKMYGMVFPKRDHELTNAENGRLALERLEASPDGFDLILLDLRMPDMNGVEFIEEVKRRAGATGQIPIILTTVEPDGSEMMQRAKTLGVSAIVKKPWKPQDLRDVIQIVTRAGIR